MWSCGKERERDSDRERERERERDIQRKRRANFKWREEDGKALPRASEPSLTQGTQF